MDISIGHRSAEAHVQERRQLATAVRLARLADAPAIAELVNRAYLVESSFVTGDRTSVGEIEAMIDSGVFLILDRLERAGHRDGGPLAAAVHVDSRRPEAFLSMLSVAPELQNGGLGRRLLGIGEAMCEASGCAAVRLQIVNLREELSRWYRGLGYGVVGTSPFQSAAAFKPCHFVELRKSLRAVGAAA